MTAKRLWFVMLQYSHRARLRCWQPCGALEVSFARYGGLRTVHRGLFVGQHGSWNRQDSSGYKVSWIDFSNRRSDGEMKDFATGFLTADGGARGRSVRVAFDPARGRLLNADDLSNTVWRMVMTEKSSVEPEINGIQ